MFSVAATLLGRRDGSSATRDDMLMNESGCVPNTLCLWTLKFESHVIFACRKIFFSFVPSFKSVKTMLSSHLYQIRPQFASPWSKELNGSTSDVALSLLLPPQSFQYGIRRFGLDHSPVFTLLSPWEHWSQLSNYSDGVSFLF